MQAFYLIAPLIHDWQTRFSTLTKKAKATQTNKAMTNVHCFFQNYQEYGEDKKAKLFTFLNK